MVERINPNADDAINTLVQSIKTWGAPPPEGTEKATQDIIRLRSEGKLSPEQERRLFIIGFVDSLGSDML